MTASDLFHLNSTYLSNIKETKFRTKRVIVPEEMTKVGFFAVIWDLKDYKNKLELILKKYKFFSTKNG